MENYIKTRTKAFIRNIAIILTIIMILQLFPPIVFGIQEKSTLQDNPNVVESNENCSLNVSNEVIGEITEKRTLNQKHFLQKDGSILTTIYPSNIHYEENGKLVDIDNSLEESSEDGGIYNNKRNSFQVKFAKKSNKNNLVKLKIQNHNVKWSLQSSNKVNTTQINNVDKTEEKFKLKNISSGTIQYENILNGIDLQYNVISNSIKENIVLKDINSIQQQLVFEFNTDNLKMEKLEDGRIIFCEENKEEVLFFLDAPYMYDSKNEMSNDIEVKLEGKNGKYTLTLIPNNEWLQDEAREYPIIIDPTVETSLNYQNIQDTYIFNGDTGYPTRHEAHILRVGSNNTLASKNPTRSLIKFGLPELSSGDQVISAMLDICSYPDTNEWTPPSETIQIDVHKMTQNWEASTASWNNLNDKYDTRIADYAKYQYDINEPAKFYYFDITSMVKDWYVTGNNYGLVLKDHIETYNASHSDAYFFSADVNKEYINARPMVQIVYRNQTGLETYQTYHTQQVGRAGIVHTNDYNGNVTLLHADASTPGQNLSVSVNHVYNTNDKNVNIGYGNGFRLNLSQTIEKVTIGSKEYAKYTDEDGTKHYFEKNGNSYTDSENLKLTLKLENDTFTLIDNSNNKFIFTKKTSSSGEVWHLSQSIDANNNIINITLINDTNAGARIEKITDSAGDSINFTYTNNSLTKITDKASRSTNYEYDSNGNLVKVTYNDGKYSEYTYSNKLLISVKNIDNLHIDYEYYNEKSNRVKSIKEYGTNNTLGNTITISYGDNVTKFIDNKGYSNTYTFNNSGQTISISDFGKEPNDIDNAYGKMYKYGEEQKDKNRLTLDGNLISIGEKENNLIKNGNFSNGFTNWSKTNCDDNDKVENGSFKFIGNSSIDKNIYQDLNISGKKGDIFTLATWVNSKAVPNNSQRAIKVSLTIHFIRKDGTRQSINKNVNVDGSGWQFKSEVVIADSDYTNAIVYLVCTYNENETYFDNVGLFKEEFGQSYTYDDNGNIVTTAELAEGQKNYEYMNNNMITKIDSNGTKYSYEYDYLNPTKLLCAKNSLGNKYNFKYDEKGNLTSTLLTGNTLVSDDVADWSTYYFRFANSEKVFNKGTNQGYATLNLKYFNGTDDQTFIIRNGTSSGQYKIYSNYSSEALEAFGKEIVDIGQAYNSNTQNWKFFKQSDGSYKITNVEEGDDYCLTLGENNNIILSKDEGKLCQRIYLYEYSSKKADLFNELVLESNEVYRIKTKNSKMYLQGTENGNVVQNTYEKENINQLWKITNIYDNLYKITNLGSSQGQAMTATDDGIKLNGDSEPSRELIVSKNENNTYQIKSYFYISLGMDNHIFTIENNSSNVQAKTILSAKNDNGSQDFTFEKANLLNIDENHYYKIKAKCSNLYLGISNSNTIEQQENNDSEGQKWRFKDLKDGTYQIISATNDTSTMQVENYDNPLTSIKFGENGINDAFEIIPRSDGTYCIKPSVYAEYFAFNISDGSTQAGTDVVLYTSNDSTAQKFYIEETGIYENGNIGKYIKTTAEYSENGKYQTKSVGENDNSISYTYDNNTGTLLNEQTDYNKHEYTYDNFDRITKVELKDNSNQVISKNEYTYEDDKLKTIKAENLTYEFVYDEFGNTKQVKVGNQTLSTKNYEDNNGNLLSENYGNNQSISYSYDRFNRITKQEGINGSYTYTYDADCNVKTIVDTINNNTKTFTYDLAQRLVKEINTNGFKKTYEYDINNNVSNIEYQLNDSLDIVKYNFDNYNRLNSIINSYGGIWRRELDSLSRISKNEISNGTKKYETNYEYLTPNVENQKTTTYISKVKNGNDVPIEYEYYSNGNIKSITTGGYVTNYYYDETNQLIRENNEQLNKTIVYTYAPNGNILTKKEYAYTTAESLQNLSATLTITYQYNNENWKDQLTNYNGKQITYDAIGNPLTYDGNDYTWQNGRQLAGISNSSKNQTITYKYNQNGIRTQKIVNGIATNYYLDGTKVIYEQTGAKTISYTYDENGNILGLNYYGYQYYYIKNAQNDIIGILDSNLNQIVSYTYDSWGNIISITDANGNPITNTEHIGYINPYRYRSYRYDTETGLYYLQSRYYNSEWGRFLNADVLVSTGKGLLCHNMYIYCENNPINREDPTGDIFGIFNFLTCLNRTIRDIFLITTPKLRIDIEQNIGEEARVSLGIISFSKRSTETISSNAISNTGYNKFDNGKPSMGIQVKIGKATIAKEKSSFGTNFSLMGNNNGFQYENEYGLIHRFSYINFSTKDKITNSAYYTVSVNYWWPAAALGIGYLVGSNPLGIGILQYAIQ